MTSDIYLDMEEFVFNSNKILSDKFTKHLCVKNSIIIPDFVPI